MKGRVGPVLAVLTQAMKAESSRDLDEIADTLVVIATTLPGSDAAAAATRMLALSILSSAGNGDNGVVGRDHSVPYNGALVRLIQIAETAVDGGIRSAALAATTSQPDKRAVLAFLKRFAQSQNEVAYVAVFQLGFQMGADGKLSARELFHSKSVSEPNALRTLNGIAQENGWR